MAEKFYHAHIKEEIKKIAENSDKYKKIGIEKKIPLPHPNQELVFHYKPEATLTTKLGKKCIFEVLDDQIKDPNLIIADIIQSYLTENVAKVVFISKNEEGSKLTLKLSRVIGAILQENGFFKKKIPHVFVYTISYQEVQTGKLQEILIKFAKKDGWG